MIVLVQNGARQQILTFDLERVALYVSRADCYLLGPLDVLSEPRDAETTFLARLLSFRRKNLGVDEYELLVGVLSAGTIDHSEALEQPDLRRRQAHARCVIHRLEHVVDEPSEFLGIEFLNGFTDRFEDRVSVLDDLSNHLELPTWGCPYSREGSEVLAIGDERTLGPFSVSVRFASTIRKSDIQDMKMPLSGWFQRGIKKLRTAEAAIENSQATTAAVGWLAEDGVAHAVTAKLGERFDGGIDILLAEEISIDTPIWLISADGFDKAAAVHFCSREQGRYTVRVGFLEDTSGLEKNTAFSAARMKWTEGSGRVVGCTILLRNGENSELAVSMAEAVPVPSVVLLTGGDYQCLGAVSSCQEEEDCWVAQVRVISDACPRANAQAA